MSLYISKSITASLCCELKTRRGKMDICVDLPEDCISRIISFTSPRDACRSAAVSPAFKLAADSDAVWERFLPYDYQEIISGSVSPPSTSLSLSKKDLYFYLCHHSVLLNDGTMSFSLDKESGKKCYMVGARRLCIAWGNEPPYWTWTDKRLLPESRFAEVAELNYVWWLDVKGRLETKTLSSKTNYAAYLVFKFAESRHGFQTQPIELRVYLEGTETETDTDTDIENETERNRNRRRVLLDPPRNAPRPYQLRGDGWMEIEMGEFFNEDGDDGVVVCSLFDFQGLNTKGGLFVEGIELRPKN